MSHEAKHLSPPQGQTDFAHQEWCRSTRCRVNPFPFLLSVLRVMLQEGKPVTVEPSCRQELLLLPPHA
eukprot:4149820-Amphidinium_carterae.1